MTLRTLLWRYVCTFFEPEVFRVRHTGCLLGEASTYAVCSHRVACLASEVRDLGATTVQAACFGLAADKVADLAEALGVTAGQAAKAHAFYAGQPTGKAARAADLAADDVTNEDAGP